MQKEQDVSPAHSTSPKTLLVQRIIINRPSNSRHDITLNQVARHVLRSRPSRVGCRKRVQPPFPCTWASLDARKPPLHPFFLPRRGGPVRETPAQGVAPRGDGPGKRVQPPFPCIATASGAQKSRLHPFFRTPPRARGPELAFSESALVASPFVHHKTRRNRARQNTGQNNRFTFGLPPNRALPLLRTGRQKTQEHCVMCETADLPSV